MELSLREKLEILEESARNLEEAISDFAELLPDLEDCPDFNKDILHSLTREASLITMSFFSIESELMRLLEDEDESEEELVSA